MSENRGNGLGIIGYGVVRKFYKQPKDLETTRDKYNAFQAFLGGNPRGESFREEGN